MNGKAKTVKKILLDRENKASKARELQKKQVEQWLEENIREV